MSCTPPQGPGVSSWQAWSQRLCLVRRSREILVHMQTFNRAILHTKKYSIVTHCQHNAYKMRIFILYMLEKRKTACIFQKTLHLSPVLLRDQPDSPRALWLLCWVLAWHRQIRLRKALLLQISGGDGPCRPWRKSFPCCSHAIDHCGAPWAGFRRQE